MKHRYIAVAVAALLLTGCADLQQNTPAEPITEETGEQTALSADETTAAQTAAPITLQTVTQADIVMPDLSAIGIDTAAFAPADEPYVITYGYDEIAYDGEPPKETLYAYYNPQKDRLLFDQYGRLVSYDAYEQTVWNLNPDPNAYTTVTDDESLKTTGPNGETAAPLPPASGSTPADNDNIIYLDDGRILHSKDAYGVQMLSADEFRSIADNVLDAVVPERETFTERDEYILQETPSQTYYPCSVSITRRYNDDISDSASVSLDYDGRVQSFGIDYANITDLSVSEQLRAKAAAYARELYSSNPEITEINGYCRNLEDTVYGWYSVTMHFGDGYGCDEILVRADG